MRKNYALKTALNIIIALSALLLINAAKNDVWRTYSKHRGFCSTSLNLFIDSTYEYEYGCEGRSNYNLGRWQIENGKIKLISIDTANYNFISSARQSKNNNNDTIAIRFIDMSESPISGLTIANLPDDFSISEYSSDIEKSKYKDKRKKTIIAEYAKTNYTGFVFLKKNEIKSLFISKFLATFNKRVEIDANLCNCDTLTIKLGIRDKFFLFNETKWANFKYIEIKNQPDSLEILKTVK